MENLDIVEFYKKEKNTSKLLPMYRNFYTEAEIFIEKINNITEKNNINSTYMLLKEKRSEAISGIRGK